MARGIDHPVDHGRPGIHVQSNVHGGQNSGGGKRGKGQVVRTLLKGGRRPVENARYWLERSAGGQSFGKQPVGWVRTGDGEVNRSPILHKLPAGNAHTRSAPMLSGTEGQLFLNGI